MAARSRVLSTLMNGGEYWLARELQPLLGYEKWERFEETIERAEVAIANVGQDADFHISRRREKLEPGPGRPPVDYRLTRFGSSMVTMNGDPRKRAIALGQAYFAAKTYQAELLEKHFLDNPDLIQISLNLAAVPKEIKNTSEYRAQVKQHVKTLSPRYPYLCPSHFLLSDFLKEKGVPITPMVLLHFGKFVAVEFELMKGKKPKKGVRKSKKVDKAGFYAGGDWRVCERAWEKFQGHWSLTRALEA